MDVLPFRTIKNMARKGFAYLFSVNIYTYRLAFSSILPCV